MNRKTGEQGSSAYGERAGREIYVIAEAGVNHNGRLDSALLMVAAAKEAGADCVKFQAFGADELAVKEAVKAPYQKLSGDAGESQYEMLRRCELGVEDFRVIKDHCEKCRIDFLATPFSCGWVEVLSELGVGALKVGSGNLGQEDLLAAIGSTHLPVIVSSGMSELTDVSRAIGFLRESGCGKLTLLHCVSMYPTPLEQVNLGAIRMLEGTFGAMVSRFGLSDHTEEVITGALAVAAGATVLEKHFTLDRSLEGPDHKMSLGPEALGEYIGQVRLAVAACGNGQKEILPEERLNKEAVGMSVVAAKCIQAGSIISIDMLTCKRPGTGIPAHKIGEVVGAVAQCDLKIDQVLRESMISRE